MELCIDTYTPCVLAAKQLIEKTCSTRSCKTQLVNPEIMRNYRLVSCNFWIHEHYKWDTTSLLLFSEGEGMRNQTADAEPKSLVNYLRALHIWKESWGNRPRHNGIESSLRSAVWVALWLMEVKFPLWEK